MQDHGTDELWNTTAARATAGRPTTLQRTIWRLWRAWNWLRPTQRMNLLRLVPQL